VSGLTERVARALWAKHDAHGWPSDDAEYVEDARVALGAVADDVDGLAGVLRDHQPASIYDSRESTTGCICGADLPVAGGYNRDGYPNRPDADTEAHLIHQAEQLAAHIRDGA
jgi:hypothetical protein